MRIETGLPWKKVPQGKPPKKRKELKNTNQKILSKSAVSYSIFKNQTVIKKNKVISSCLHI